MTDTMTPAELRRTLRESPLERMFAAQVEAAGLPTPEREAAGLSMNALAAVAGVTQKNVAFIEKGRRQYTSGSVVKRLARALGIEEGVLVG